MNKSIVLHTQCHCFDNTGPAFSFLLQEPYSLYIVQCAIDPKTGPEWNAICKQ